jgi:dTDP-4-dehydrorhamnose 3,5-epimerase
MEYNRIDLELAGLQLIECESAVDDRGYFSEIWKKSEFPEFKQMNMSVSNVCTFRGLHYQWDRPQGKLIRVESGHAVFFELDIRSYSPTFGQHCIVELNDAMNKWLWVPPGFANAFFAKRKDTRIVYMCTEEWSKNEGSINRSVLNFPFELLGDIREISEKDRNAPSFEDSIDHLKSISGFFRNDHEGIV